MNIEDNMT